MGVIAEDSLHLFHYITHLVISHYLEKMRLLNCILQLHYILE